MPKGKVPVDLKGLVRVVEQRTVGCGPLDRVAEAVKYSEALKEVGDQLVGHFVDEARATGSSWAQIGAHLGITKQAAQQRHTLRRLFRSRRARSGGLGPLRLFSEEGRRVVTTAQEEARRLNHNYLGTEHLLLGLLRDRQSRASRVLRELGVSGQGVRSRVKQIIGEGTEVPTGPIPFTPRSKKVLELSVEACQRSGEPAAAPHHILLGLLDEGEGVAAAILKEFGVTRRKVQATLAK
jgi:hypothetical protein